MKRLAAIIAACAISTPALADDPSFSWSGFYVGAHGGYAWADADLDLSKSSGAIHYNDHFANARPSLSADGFHGGLQVGANYQVGSLVFGIEADASMADLDASGRFTTKAPNHTTWDVSSKVEAFGTVRGRMGIVSGPILLYGTAGLAWGVTKNEQATNWFAPAPPDVGGRTSGREAHVGWAAGAGAEWAIGNGWALKAEYLYVDLGDQTYALNGTTKPGGNVPYTETYGVDWTFHTARVGINYRF